MVMINLLPWRELKHAYEVRIIKKIMMSILFSHVVIAFFAYILLTEINRECKIRIFHLNTQMKKENIWQNQNTHSDVNQVKKANHVLLSDHLAIIQFFHLLQKNRPNTLCFFEIKRNHDNWLLTGKTHTINDLMMMLKSWHDTSFFSFIKISHITAKQDGWQFHLFAIEKHSIREDF